MICEPAYEWLKSIYSWLGTISIVLALASIAAHVIYYKIKKVRPNLVTAIAKMAAGSVIAPAAALIISVFDLDHLLDCIKNLEIYVLAGSIAILWISFTVLFPSGGLETPQRPRRL
jgi:hypothetical protein